jgi:hypothetical protein
MKIRQNKMMSYLAVTAGVGCVSSVANAAVVFYGNASNNNVQADPVGINMGDFGGGNFGLDVTFSVGSVFIYGASETPFSQGSDRGSGYNNVLGFYASGGNLILGAVAGVNYVNVTFDGFDGVAEAVAQFYLDGAGGGYLMAIATTNAIPNPQNLSAVGGSALSISAGKAMIDAAAVPEPSSLVLLALGATGLVARRSRKQAA